jgi:ubiquinone/menaquinone biosynthesis C-methylase UbiE
MHKVLQMTTCLMSLSLALVFVSARAEDTPPSHQPKPYAAEMNKKFQDEAEIQEFVKRFESEDRDIYLKRQDITHTLGLKAGDKVADIGAGTGLFSFLFAKEVGPKGIVFAVDISPTFIAYIKEHAKQQGHEQVVKAVLSKPDSAELAANSIDVAFVCDTYHHFEHPEKMLASIHTALRPGGRLVIIDFDLQKDSSEFIKKRARAPKEVYYREISAAGFEKVEMKNAPAIKDNFYAEFRRVEPKTHSDRPTR